MVLCEYRGYGLSFGSAGAVPSEAGLYDDAEAVFAALAKAPRVTTPALLLHGTADEVVPYSMGARLADVFPHARLITVPGGHHNDLFLGQGFRLFDRVADFVRRAQ